MFGFIEDLFFKKKDLDALQFSNDSYFTKEGFLEFEKIILGEERSREARRNRRNGEEKKKKMDIVYVSGYVVNPYKRGTRYVVREGETAIFMDTALVTEGGYSSPVINIIAYGDVIFKNSKRVKIRLGIPPRLPLRFREDAPKGTIYGKEIMVSDYVEILDENYCSLGSEEDYTYKIYNNFVCDHIIFKGGFTPDIEGYLSVGYLFIISVGPPWFINKENYIKHIKTSSICYTGETGGQPKKNKAYEK